MPWKFVLQKKKIQPWRNQKPFLKGSNLTQMNFVGTDRGIDERVVELVIVLKIPWEGFKASNCMALRFLDHEGFAICQVIRLYCSKV